MKLTLIITKGENGFFVGQLKEIPSVISQGKTEDELVENIKDALEFYLEDMREEFSMQNPEHSVVKEKDMVYITA